MGTLGSSLQSRLSRGLGAQSFSQAVQLIVRVAEVPLFLGFWGTQLYGEWLILAAIPAYLSISDGGFSAAAVREMTMRSSAGDRKGALAVFQSTWLLLLVVSLVLAGLSFAFVVLAPLVTWLGFLVMQGQEIRLVLVLLVLHILVGFQGGLLQGGFWVAGSYPVGMALQATTELLEFCGLAAAVALGGGPLQAAAGYLAGRVVGTGLMWARQRRISPWLRFGFETASWRELRNLTPPAFASLAFPLGNALNIQGMRLIVGLVLGPSAVALFSPLRTLSRLAMQPRTVVNRLVQPEMGLAYGSEDSNLFRRLFGRSCQLTFWVTLASSLAVGGGATWIFPKWTGGSLAIDWPAFILLLAGVLANGVWYTALMVPYATNRHGRIAVLYTVFYGILPFGMAYLGANAQGLAGVALALFTAEVVMTGIVLRVSLRMAKMSIGEWGNQVLSSPIRLLSDLRILFRNQATS